MSPAREPVYKKIKNVHEPMPIEPSIEELQSNSEPIVLTEEPDKFQVSNYNLQPSLNIKITGKLPGRLQNTPEILEFSISC